MQPDNALKEFFSVTKLDANALPGRLWNGNSGNPSLSVISEDPFVLKHQSSQHSEPVTGWISRNRLHSGKTPLVLNFQLSRRYPCFTLFHRHQGQVLIDKLSITSSHSYVARGRTLALNWVPSQDVPYLEGMTLSEQIEQSTPLSQVRVEAKLIPFLSWSLARMNAFSVDALFVNAISSNNEYALFDLEWKLDPTISPSFFVFRNCFAIGRLRTTLEKHQLSFTLEQLYTSLCLTLKIIPQFAADLNLEAELQSLASANSSVDYHRTEINRWFTTSFKRSPIQRALSLLFKR